MKIRIATRKSKLALWQSKFVAKRLELLPNVTSTSLIPIQTSGDKIQDKVLYEIGGKGLFIKELEIALESGQADIAVHSMKDVPTNISPKFCIPAVLKRSNPADVLVSQKHILLKNLPKKSKIGTSSPRRQSQIKSIRPDLEIIALRGNVDTRLKKLSENKCDAIILAYAGLSRLGLEEKITEEFSLQTILPAACQGVIGIECLTNNKNLINQLKTLQDPSTYLSTSVERAMLKVLDADCNSPIASYAEINSNIIKLTGLVASLDGKNIIKEEFSSHKNKYEEIGVKVGKKLLEKGAKALLNIPK